MRLKTDFAEAQNNWGNLLREQGRLAEAETTLRAALRIQPRAAQIHSNLILTLNYHPDHDARSIYEECRRWNEQHAEPLRNLIRPHANRPDPERRLRIGYVSPDFRGLHVDTFFTLPLLSNHDHRQFEVYCYASVANPDELTARLRGFADVWHSTVGLSDGQIAELIRGSDRHPH